VCFLSTPSNNKIPGVKAALMLAGKLVPIPEPLPSEDWGGAGPSAALQLLEIALLLLRRSALQPDPPRSRLLGPGFRDGNFVPIREPLPSEDWGGAGPSAALLFHFSVKRGREGGRG